MNRVKIILIFLFVVIFSSTSMAQLNDYELRMERYLSSPNNQISKNDLQKLIRMEKDNNDKYITGYLNFADEIDNFFSNQVLKLSYIDVFPDSTIIIEYLDSKGDTVYEQIWNHGVGGIYDRYFREFYPVVYSPYDSVFVDSIWLNGNYTRNDSSSDSLILEIFAATTELQLLNPFKTYSWPSGTFNNLNPNETPFMFTIPYEGDSINNGFHNGIVPKNIIVKRFAIPLNQNDTGLKSHAFDVSLVLDQPCHGLSYVFSFKPDPRAYNVGDTISHIDKSGPNRFRAAILSNKSDKDQNAYFIQFYASNSTNSNQFIPKETRYSLWNITNANLNSMTFPNPKIAGYITIKAHGNNYPRYRSCFAGINEKDNLKTIVAKIKPNPVQTIVSIEYSIGENVSLEFRLYDITGTKLITIVENPRHSGINEFDIDCSSLPSGIYHYVLEGNGHRAAGKLAVLK